MPIYEYECLSKGHRFDEMQKINSMPLRKCRICGGKVKKLISATSFQLKGGGWYKDGYAGGSGNGATSSDSSSSNGTKSESTAKADAKPAKEKKARTE